jgi:hypothetical protein
MVIVENGTIISEKWQEIIVDCLNATSEGKSATLIAVQSCTFK